MSMTEAEIFEKVQTVLEDALGVDADEVTPEAKLEADLGAESIDYLDIVFRLEKAFPGIKIEQGELFPESVLNESKPPPIDPQTPCLAGHGSTSPTSASVRTSKPIPE